ncbi:mushroom body large-type Kenyon cell-specific protein 1 isoform X2 [Hydra vulgaris]|uniref:mushroom body large-type Kenyon cell-specific protein 1 isoform X2 n=1 Tax=Hydra vulgaris TaxID=6087 RepID=UPI0032E9F1FD
MSEALDDDLMFMVQPQQNAQQQPHSEPQQQLQSVQQQPETQQLQYVQQQPQSVNFQQMFLQSMEEMFNNFLKKMEVQSSQTPSLSMAAAATTPATITTTTTTTTTTTASSSSSATSAAAADLSYEAFIAYRRSQPGPISYRAHRIWASNNGADLPSFRWGRRRRNGRGGGRGGVMYNYN